MTAAIPLLRSLSYIGGLFGYAVMGYVLAAWVGDAVDAIERLRRSKRDNKRVADARAEAGKSDHSATGQ